MQAIANGFVITASGHASAYLGAHGPRPDHATMQRRVCVRSHMR
jgi:hypothetical protein